MDIEKTSCKKEKEIKIVPKIELRMEDY